MISLIYQVTSTFGLLFHRFWDGVLLCLYVCIAKGSEVSISRRHACVCGLWVVRIICDVLITCTKLGLSSGGSMSTSKREIRVLLESISSSLMQALAAFFPALGANLHGAIVVLVFFLLSEARD
jgi:hypothetical protein